MLHQFLDFLCVGKPMALPFVERYEAVNIWMSLEQRGDSLIDDKVDFGMWKTKLKAVA